VDALGIEASVYGDGVAVITVERGLTTVYCRGELANPGGIATARQARGGGLAIGCNLTLEWLVPADPLLTGIKGRGVRVVAIGVVGAAAARSGGRVGARASEAFLAGTGVPVIAQNVGDTFAVGAGTLRVHTLVGSAGVLRTRITVVAILCGVAAEVVFKRVQAFTLAGRTLVHGAGDTVVAVGVGGATTRHRRMLTGARFGAHVLGAWKKVIAIAALHALGGGDVVGCGVLLW
jgi:hypothetical protein